MYQIEAKPLEARFDSLFVFIRCAARSLALGLDLAADMCSPRVRLVEYRRPPCAFVSIWCCVLPLADCQADCKSLSNRGTWYVLKGEGCLNSEDYYIMSSLAAAARSVLV